MNFVIPMAGKGQRFIDAGYRLPKMLIEAEGKTLLEWSVGSLPLDLCSKLVFIGLKEHKEKYNLHKFIEKKYKDKCNIVQIYLDQLTRGQSDTVLKAERIIDFEKPLLIYNIDTAFTSKSLKEHLLQPNIDGVLGSFNSVLPQYSFAKLYQNSFVIEVAEKVVISNNALTGLYYFAKASDFIEVAKEAIAKNERVKNEFYIAPLYNKLIAKGKKYIIDSVDEFHVLGTPEELNTFIHG